MGAGIAMVSAAVFAVYNYYTKKGNPHQRSGSEGSLALLRLHNDHDGGFEEDDDVSPCSSIVVGVPPYNAMATTEL